MKRPNLQSLLKRRRRSQAATQVARLKGDRARDTGDWINAVAHYREHLTTNPRDGAIRVQLGHALKEAGSFDDALDAYRTALARMPGDADLLLSIGHVHKLMGDHDQALVFYRQSADRNGNKHALLEIDHLQHVRPVPAGPKNAPGVLAALSGHSQGLTPVETSDMILAAGGARLQFVSQDPWVSFDLDGTIAAAAGLGILRIDVRPVDRDNLLSGQLYIDYGDGFDEKTSLPFTSGTAPVSLLLACPERIKQVRWDPDRKSNVIHLPTLTFRAITDFADAEAVIEENASRDLDITPLVELAQACFARVAMTAQEAAEASLILMVSEFDLGAHYRRWLFKYERPSAQDYAVIDRMTAAMTS